MSKRSLDGHKSVNLKSSFDQIKRLLDALPAEFLSGDLKKKKEMAEEAVKYLEPFVDRLSREDEPPTCFFAPFVPG